jgi:hypothetical protein
MSVMRRCRVVVVLLALVAWPSDARSQARLTGADLEGMVADQSGAVLPGVLVTATNVATNVSRTVTTDLNGRYYVAALPPGTYRIIAALSGFLTQTTDDLVLRLGQSVVLNFTLHLEGVSAAVTVSAEPPIVEASRTEVSTVIDQEQIEALPINGRNFISFSVLTPGVTNDRTPQQGASATSGLSFGGQRARSNNIMVDGFDNNDQVVGAVRATFSQEAVREFQVLTNSYSAEFGKASGGVVNIVTKSGTNDLHGNAFYYFRDDAMNARSYFEQHDIFGNPVDLDKAPFDQEQWGGTVGGPISKNRTFFFGSFEQTDILASNLVTIQPDAAAVLNSLGFPVQLGNVPYAVERTEVLGKLDHNWRPGHAFVMRASFADIENENVEPFGGTVARSRGAVQLRRDWSLAASHTDVISDRWVNELRLQYAPQNQDVLSLDCSPPCAGENEGGPTLEVSGVASVGRQRFTPNPRENQRLQIGNTISYLTGNHQVKAGVEVNQIRTDRGALPLHFGGRYIFSPIPALGVTTALDALRRGLPSAYVQGYGDSKYPFDSSDVSLFVQDEWRLGRAVIKPGLRYQRQFWPEFPYDIGDVGGTRFQYNYPDDSNNVAPRVALAYDVTGDGRTPVHGSYGMYFDNTLTSMAGITQILDGADNVRTLVVTLAQSCAGVPCSVLAWNAPGRRLPEPAAAALLGGRYPTLQFAIDPALQTPYAHQASAGFQRALGADYSIAADFVYVRGFHQVGTIDYNPVVSTLGAGRRPNDFPCTANPAAPCVSGGIPGSSASILQYTAFGETWYRGLTSSLRGRLSGKTQVLVSYTLSKAEDNSTDFQSNFIPENNGRGRNPEDQYGLPVGFDPMSEKGLATHDQRHRFVASGTYVLPYQFVVSGILTAASGRPFSPLAGLDVNGDGNGGAFPPDRARRVPTDPATSVGRNSEVTAAIVNVDLRASKVLPLGAARLELIFDVFNLFNRANFIEDTNQSSFAIFGVGAYPDNPLPTYGRYTLTEPPRQMQLAAKISF